MSLTRSLTLPLVASLSAGAPSFDPFNAGETLAVPTTAQADRFVWRDAINGTVTGPAPQSGSAVGADTNDPTLVTTVPAHEVFGADDYLTWFANLDALFASVNGFSLVLAIGRDAANAALETRPLHKQAPNEETLYVSAGGTGVLRTFIRLVGGGFEDVSTGAGVLNEDRYIIGIDYNPTLARGSRIRFHKAGVDITPAGSSAGSDGAVITTTQPFRIGMDPDGQVPASHLRAFGGYLRPLTTPEHLEIATALGGWAT